ncbi:MAG: YifB family Mg chelatase-like AAA ATPase [Helicobacteraceae bacterium]|nr:YifB family Mg chelatase-like AAA ATPase [Helicobacteraceae bacterium]
MKRIRSATLELSIAKEVVIEASFTRGLPAFSIVGLADEAIKEAKDRVKSALLLSGYQFPPLKITVNLSPSDLKKSGSQMDLPIALLIALEKEEAVFDDLFCFGELGLDGAVRSSPSIFALALSLATQGLLKRVVCDPISAEQIARIPNVKVYAVKTLIEAVAFFRQESAIAPMPSSGFSAKKLTIDDRDYYYEDGFEQDFSEVRGQTLAKRAALIAAAGFHNLILSGSPGCGKSMIIKRMAWILPPMSLNEVLCQASLDSLEGKTPVFKATRAFRHPHHTATRASIFGGGSRESKMGESALSSGGILFFDELPHFPKAILEALREPLEDHRLLISRVHSKVVYETRFLFAGAMNPCPCGNLLSRSKECRCTQIDIARYQSRLSEPFLERIDLFVQMNDSDPNAKADQTSRAMRQEVFNAFAMQKKRAQNEFNGKLSDADTDRFCHFDDEASKMLIEAAVKFGLSDRSVGKIRRISRTIADLAQSETIGKAHLLEALSFRRR